MSERYRNILKIATMLSVAKKIFKYVFRQTTYCYLFDMFFIPKPNNLRLCIGITLLTYFTSIK